MEVPSDILPVRLAAAASDYPIGRSYLAKVFKLLLIITPLAAVSSCLCFINGISYWDTHPRHFCKLTSYCERLLSLPPLLCFFCTLGLIPALMTLDHLLALSPVFGNKGVTNESINHASNDDDSQPPSTPWRGTYTRAFFRIFTISAYSGTILWVVASASATTSAALIIKYDAPFDRRSDTLLRQKVIVGLMEAAVDLVLAALVAWLGLLCSRTRRCIEAAAASTHTSGDNTASTPWTVSGVPLNTTILDIWYALVGWTWIVGAVLLNTTLLDVWNGVRGPWDRRTGLDRPILSLIVSFALIMVCAIFHFAFSPPEWPYFSSVYFLLSIVLAYPFLFAFNEARVVGVIPSVVSRCLALLILSFLSAFWVFVSTSFITAAIYGLFCNRSSRPQVPYPLPCTGHGQLESFVMGVLGFLLAFAFGNSAFFAWKSNAGVQLVGDSEEDSRGGNDTSTMQQGA
ncbi:hypothetical protein BKA70DRAFT_1343053 [Coprinopsis sp. MPI-PUGE-AT-0042]|nr:hypothetical protein BKA70DRAFT_1343053 [Coprinopsis sp. MPI-PUGE-AT-0042]